MSGAGKSTLIRCMNLLECPTSGTIQIDGQDVTGLSKKALRQMRHSVGMIFQQFNLLNADDGGKKHCLSAGDHRCGQGPVRKARKRAFGDCRAIRQGRRVSGPAFRRAKAARGHCRALAANPKVLLCDEATSALDPMTTDSILELLKRINQQMGITIVVITHEMEVIRKICHRVAIIDGGVIAEQGEVTEIFTAPKTAAAEKAVSCIAGGRKRQGRRGAAAGF